MMKDSLNNMVSLTHLLEDISMPIVVCRFSQSMCSSCVNSAVSIMLNHIDSIGVVRVMFMGQSRNSILFKQMLPLYGLQEMQVYNVASLALSIEDSNYPYYFMLDKNLEVYNLFVPNKGLPYHTHKYLEGIQEEIKSNKIDY